jgi:hypothetical protein
VTGRTVRVLVTGSRGWPWPTVVHRALEEARARLGPDDTLTVVHGACPDGADQHASAWARQHRDNPTTGLAAVLEEEHPADWDTCQGPHCTPQHRKYNKATGFKYCPSAGHLRNAEMVESRPDLWLGFCLDDSNGTDGCIRACRRARLNGRAWYAYSATA